MGVVFDRERFIRRLERSGAFEPGQTTSIADALHAEFSASIAAKTEGLFEKQQPSPGSVTDVRDGALSSRSDFRRMLFWNKIFIVGSGAAVIAAAIAMKYLH